MICRQVNLLWIEIKIMIVDDDENILRLIALKKAKHYFRIF